MKVNRNSIHLSQERSDGILSMALAQITKITILHQDCSSKL